MLVFPRRFRPSADRPTRFLFNEHNKLMEIDLLSGAVFRAKMLIPEDEVIQTTFNGKQQFKSQGGTVYLQPRKYDNGKGDGKKGYGKGDGKDKDGKPQPSLGGGGPLGGGSIGSGPSAPGSNAGDKGGGSSSTAEKDQKPKLTPLNVSDMFLLRFPRAVLPDVFIGTCMAFDPKVLECLHVTNVLTCLNWEKSNPTHQGRVWHTLKERAEQERSAKGGVRAEVLYNQVRIVLSEKDFSSSSKTGGLFE